MNGEGLEEYHRNHQSTGLGRNSTTTCNSGLGNTKVLAAFFTPYVSVTPHIFSSHCHKVKSSAMNTMCYISSLFECFH